MESLSVIEKLCYNAVVSPGDVKYRRIRLGNRKIKEMLVEEAGAMDVMALLGWERIEDEADGSMLVLPMGKQVTMSEVRAVQDAQHECKKRIQKMNSSIFCGSSAPVLGSKTESRLSVGNAGSGFEDVQESLENPRLVLK